MHADMAPAKLWFIPLSVLLIYGTTMFISYPETHNHAPAKPQHALHEFRESPIRDIGNTRMKIKATQLSNTKKPTKEMTEVDNSTQIVSRTRFSSSDISDSPSSKLSDREEEKTVKLQDNESASSNHISQAVEQCNATTRLERIREVCLERGWEEKRSDVELNFLLTDDVHKVLFCPITKVGCTTFKQLMIQNSETPDASHVFVHGAHVLEAAGIKSLNTYSNAEIEYRLKHYFKFAVVRHPFDRLMSAYHQKFSGNPLNFAPQFTSVIHEHFGMITANDTEGRILLNANQFLELVATEPKRFRDRHWKNYMSFCHPCLIQYDHVVYMETMDDDIGIVLDHLAYPNGTIPVLPHRNENRDANARIEEVYDVYTGQKPEIIKGLLAIYGRDIDVFGYTWNHTTGAGCEKCVC